MEKFKGIVFYRKKFHDDDLLIKILTDTCGKKTFFLKRGRKTRNRLSYGLQAFTIGEYIGKISDKSFSFINEVISEKIYQKIYQDIEKSAYVQYIFSLYDSAFEDSRPIANWFKLLECSLDAIENNADTPTLTHAFELKLLNVFGVNLDFFSCQICQRRDLPLDLSFKYDGMICMNHFEKDRYRFHLTSRIVKCIQVLKIGSVKSIAKMQIDPKNMKTLDFICNQIYSNYVGIYPKTKSFIDKLHRSS